MAENAVSLAGVHGVVLAGAYPTGRSPLDRIAPRPLLPVAQQPIVAYALRWLEGGGVRRATACVNSTARGVRVCVESLDVGVRVDYLEDWSPRGPAGCVCDAAARAEDAETLLVCDATAIPQVDVEALLSTHREAGAALTVVVGADATGRLRPTGVYVFERRACRLVPEEGFFDIKERLVPRLYAAGEVVWTHMASTVAPRVLSVDSYLAANHWMIEHLSRQDAATSDFLVRGQALVHRTAEVDPEARPLGPILLGPRVVVHAGATLVGPVSLGADAVVGENAVVSRSVALERTVVGREAFVDRSMLGAGTRILPGETVFAAVKIAGDEPASARTARPGRAVWGSIRAALGPTPQHP